MKHLITIIFLVLSYNLTLGQERPLGIKALYRVITEIECPNSKGKIIKLKSLMYDGELFAKNNRYIYWDKAKYLNEVTSSLLSVFVENETISTIICIDSIQNIQYANADSGIWRSQLFQGVEGGYQEYYKGYLQSGNWRWKILPEIKNVFGLECQRAQMYHGVNLQLDVWFCSKIPIDFGPFGQLNLPGLLVEGTNLNTNTHYTLQLYELTDKIDDSIFWPMELHHSLTKDYTMAEQK